MSSLAPGRILRPGATIGILGGGQLGRMMVLAGIPMGFEFACLDPGGVASPCGQVAGHTVKAPFDDLDAAAELASSCDRITYEFENVSPDVVSRLVDGGLMPQGAELLATSRHRLREKQALQNAGFPVAPFARVVDEESLNAAIEQVGLPAVLKTATGGYDGKGQAVVHTEAEALQALEDLGPRELVLEGFIPFEKELSVVVARSIHGDVEAFPVAENEHVDGILRVSIAPARIPSSVAVTTVRTAERLAEALGVVGVVGVEFFLLPDGSIVINEIAPRPHNSGHYTMDGCTTDQFEQHLRAICGWPLGNPGMHTPVVMANLLGEEARRWGDEIDKIPAGLEVKTHLYGKAEARPGRKMGHINIVTEYVDQALEFLGDRGLRGAQR